MNTDPLLPVAIDLLVKSTGILLLAFAVQSLWRCASAAQRCLMWAMAFMVLALLPVALLITPRWPVTLKQTVPAAPIPAKEVLLEADWATRTKAPLATMSGESSLPGYNAAEAGFGIWMTGVVMLLGWRLIGVCQVRRLREKSVVLRDARVSAMASRITAELRIRRRIELRSSTQVPVPLTWGLMRPALLLPHGLLSSDDPRCRRRCDTNWVTCGIWTCWRDGSCPSCLSETRSISSR